MKKYIPIEKDNFRLYREKEIFKDEALALKKYYYEKEQYHHIEKELLIEGSNIVFDLFIHTNLAFQPILAASESSPVRLPPEILAKEGDIVIKSTDISLYHEYIKSLEDTFLSDVDTSHSDRHEEKIKALLIKEKSKIIVRNVFSDPNSGKNIKESGKIIEQMAASILGNKNMLYDLISIKNHDYYTYVHSSNTAVLSIGTGIAVNLPEDEIYRLGFGALLHDIGKVSIPSGLLNKPGRLTSFEYRVMQNHVMEGEKILKVQPYFPGDSLSAVSQHHEKLSGQGYPLNLQGSAISDFGKITAIADCYDALTTQRPYKPAQTPFEALSVIVNDCEHYDPEYLKAFIKMLGGVEE